MARLKEDLELRLVEKDAVIKGLREAAQRISTELRDKTSEISRIKSPSMTPHLRSPSQSFVAENMRHEEELRLLTDQLERKIDEIGKLKKERDARNKQYKDLEIEYESLQEENNRRRIEVNNMKRQGVAV
jgi:chromosome segregation ATPase